MYVHFSPGPPDPTLLLTLDSVVKVPLSLHRLLGHDLKQVVGVGNDL